MSKQSVSRAASTYPVYTYPILDKWADIEYQRKSEGLWMQRNPGFNPLRSYIQEIKTILTSGTVGNRDTLQELCNDLLKMEDDFNTKNLEGLCNGKRWEGGKV